MKKYLLWSFERGSKPYDIICGIILAFIFLTPSEAFDDRADYMRVTITDPIVRNSHDDKGNPVYTVRLQSWFGNDEAHRAEAIRILSDTLKAPVEQIQQKQTHMEPVYDYTGALKAYAIWMQR
jgi:hypothetical protein